jgi:hypothetical protein
MPSLTRNEIFSIDKVLPHCHLLLLVPEREDHSSMFMTKPDIFCRDAWRKTRQGLHCVIDPRGREAC